MATTKARPTRTVYTEADMQKTIRARYDVAQTTTENANLWAGTDSLGAATANNPAVRQTIRTRARYEYANNSYCAGMVNTRAHDVVGPHVQIHLGSSEAAQKAEDDFAKWAKAVCLWSKIRTAEISRTVDGECLAQMVTNPGVCHDIKLDVQLIECDRVESWAMNGYKGDELDGIKYDAFGNPTEYRILKHHPGDHRAMGKAGDWVRRRYILHYFAAFRPGQLRGVSCLVHGLSLFGQLRRYTSAVIETAARAAEISLILKTKLLPDGSGAAELPGPTVSFEVERNMIMSIPEGWETEQLKPEQPCSTYKAFKDEIINESARQLDMPFNVAACNSSGYNYASGRLDHQTYDRSIDVIRALLAEQMLDRIYAEWIEEYAARRGLSAADRAELEHHDWFFVARPHVDPSKEATADGTRLENGTLTEADYWARRGADAKRKRQEWIDEQLDAEAAWNEGRNARGLVPAPMPRKAGSQVPAPERTEEDEDEDN